MNNNQTTLELDEFGGRKCVLMWVENAKTPTPVALNVPCASLDDAQTILSEYPHPDTSIRKCKRTRGMALELKMLFSADSHVQDVRNSLTLTKQRAEENPGLAEKIVSIITKAYLNKSPMSKSLSDEEEAEAVAAYKAMVKANPPPDKATIATTAFNKCDWNLAVYDERGCDIFGNSPPLQTDGNVSRQAHCELMNKLKRDLIHSLAMGEMKHPISPPTAYVGSSSEAGTNEPPPPATASNIPSLTTTQRLLLERPTPQDMIKIRKHDGMRYVEIAYVLREINNIFGDAWNLTSELVNITDTDVTVKVTITVQTPTGVIVREHFGCQARPPKMLLGDAIKAAESDGIRKVLTTFGLHADMYMKDGESPSVSIIGLESDKINAAQQSLSIEQRTKLLAEISSLLFRHPKQKDILDNYLEERQLTLINASTEFLLNIKRKLVAIEEEPPITITPDQTALLQEMAKMLPEHEQSRIFSSRGIKYFDEIKFVSTDMYWQMMSDTKACLNSLEQSN
ncbi:MAG: hypothetical protein BWK79_05315 [Beggiatoa sp. IS2]|nr:MAG: hypothetical protein BWK79_05315 [Beggiatoa sp. IS2]